MTYDDAFRAIFRENVRRRSRTAKGQDKGSETSKSKKPLLLQGEELAAKVAENAERLIDDVLANANLDFGSDGAAAWLRTRCERWFDIANDGLYGPGAYEAEFAALSADAARLSASIGRTIAVNPRYRLWTPGYTTLKVPPVLLEVAMDEFYARLGHFVRRVSEGEITRRARVTMVACMMAWADLMMDGEIHPWMDGCGRVSTALVMWLAATAHARVGLPIAPPLFAESKDAHYAAIRHLDDHTAYYEVALDRGAAFSP